MAMTRMPVADVDSKVRASVDVLGRGPLQLYFGFETLLIVLGRILSPTGDSPTIMYVVKPFGTG